MTERGLVEVPENAVRDEPLAFGLTASQLLLCGAAVGIGALLNLVPLWLPAKLVLVLVLRRAGRSGGDPAGPGRTRVPLGRPRDPVLAGVADLARGPAACAR